MLTFSRDVAKALARSLCLIALAGTLGLSQVKVNVRLDQLSYLEGEPVFVVADVRNTGIEPLGYRNGDGQAALSVSGVQPRQPTNLRGCYSSAGTDVAFGGGIDHSPVFKPGEVVSFHYLLEGYHLRAGDYTLHASGEVAVNWIFGWLFGAGRGPSTVTGHAQTDIIEGREFDVFLPLRIAKGTSDELRQRYVRYVLDAEKGFTNESWRARRAIAEMAPPFLEKTILGFATQPETADLAVNGLSRISTDQSRADLIDLYNKSSDLNLRRLIVDRLAEIATPKEFSFLVSLLPGHSSELEDRIRDSAVLGIGRLGGDKAVHALASAQILPSPEVRKSVALALGNTRSPAAVPVLINLYADEAARYDVCSALSTLTHYEWCDGAGTTVQTQLRWCKWWKSHGTHVQLYGPGECRPLQQLVPIALVEQQKFKTAAR